jgi:hypothetical protein
MTWQHFAVPGKPGVFTLHRDGVEAGDLALDHPYATVLAGHVVAALNDFDQTVTLTQLDRFRLRGWDSGDQYMAEVEAIRDLVEGFPTPVRVEVKDAFARHDWEFPITPDQMQVWQDELLAILADHEHTVDLVDEHPEVAA